jgi:hypothetical protein
MEINLELKKLEFQLEMRKLEQVQVQVQQVQQNLESLISRYCKNYTIYSNNRMDAIKMSVLYSHFIDWLKAEYPAHHVNAREFTAKFKVVNDNNSLGVYDSKISNLNGNSGIRNRKFKD